MPPVTPEYYPLYLAGVLGLGIAAQWLAWRLHLPSILLLLAFGFFAQLAGDPDEIIGKELLFPIVSLSVAVILFEGGMSLKLTELRETGGVVLRLVTIGAAVCWGMVGLCAYFVMGFPIELSALVGAVMVVTGPTVIAPLLNYIRPTRKIGSIAKWEGIVIDPIGAVLAVLVYEAVVVTGVNHVFAVAGLAIVKTLVVGLVLGVVSAVTLIFLLRRFWIPDFLHNASILAAILVVFAVSNAVQPESGLLTVTVLGIVLANQKRIPVRHIFEFKENLRVLLISCLFIVLAARISPAEIAMVGWQGLLFLAILIVIVRPASVFLSTIGSGLSWQQKVFLCFMAPRGIVAAAVSSVFAFEIVEEFMHRGADAATIAQAELLAPLTLLVIVGTVTFYGLTAAPVARLLGLASPNPQGLLIAGADRWVRELGKVIQDAGFQVLVVDTNYRNISAAKMAGLPAHCASILSDYVTEEINIGGIGRLLAITANDEVNALACQEFIHLFGRKEVYQLAAWDSGSGRRASVSEHLRGRVLFSEGVDFYVLARRFAAGAQIKKTSLTAEFTYADFLKRYGDSALVLFVIDEGKKLDVRTAESTSTPKPGQSLIALVDPVKPVAEEADAGEEDESPAETESPSSSSASEASAE
ncbi:cation:proton antiporter [Blastopirellula sp. J2-11]|uniref:cation:proton antiporter n=1 Tax=Blastopirellula sp. J2-11 TaxID=2943192 RepID=UPI0021C591F5|nr:sodium:proton antiporter [Blastopirellula sp. J2-11]UUO08359.1 cation:proton antiporter [Blastopirellula sp. J2-11]